MAYTLVNPYCSLKELCHELKMAPSSVPAGSELEDELKEAIFNASRWVDEYTQRDYFYHDFSVNPLVLNENSEGVFDDQIFLPYRIISVNSLSIGGDAWLPDDFSVGQFALASRLFSRRGNWPILGNTLTIYGTFGYFQATPQDVPVGMPGKISIATRLVAACLSGHNRKDIVDVSGSKFSIIESELPKLVFITLGARMPILI